MLRRLSLLTNQGIARTADLEVRLERLFRGYNFDLALSHQYPKLTNGVRRESCFDRSPHPINRVLDIWISRLVRFRTQRLGCEVL